MADTTLIYIVDDELEICELVSLHLNKAGYQTKSYENGKLLIKDLSRQIPDLIVLDVMLPDLNGMEICDFLRGDKEFAAIPILFLTAMSTENDKLRGFDLGADDYMTKPFSPRELVARVKAILRRRVSKEDNKVLMIGNELRIDPQDYQCTVKGKRIDLTTAEFKVLLLLAEHPGRVYSRNQILDHLWGKDKIVVDRTVDVHIRNLRVKLGDLSCWIHNIRGVGYKLEITK